MKSKTLAELGDLRSGYSARKRMDVEPELATHWLISARALSKVDKTIDWSGLEPISFEYDDSRYLLKENDILISTRGFFVAARVERPPKKILVSHNWVLLTPHSCLDSHYFVCWFNHPKTQQRLMLQQLGSAQLFMPFADLKKLQVPVPPMETQKVIAKLEQLRQQEQRLMQQMQQKREKIIESLIFKAITKEN